MSFKENLRKKMLIDRLARTVSLSIGSPGSYRRVDKETMRKLLDLSPYVFEKRRDLHLYFRELEPGKGEILVLDNELPLYGNTTLEDVTIRKSPELKEMVKIKCIIKILSDSDILMCKGREAVRYVQDRALELLDLRYTEKDIEQMADDGIDAFARADADDVIEALELFAEVLAYESVPAEVLVNDYVMYGARHEGTDDKQIFGPIVMYNDKTNVLRLIKRSVCTDDPIGRDIIPAVALGDEEPDAEAHKVFGILKEEVLKKKGPTLH